MDDMNIVLDDIVDEATESIRQLIHKAYVLGLEQENDNKERESLEVKVGAVVVESGVKGVIDRVLYDCDLVYVLWSNGECTHEIKEWAKTHMNGDTIDIGSMLEMLRD